MNARDGKLDSFHNNNLDKGNIEKGWPFRNILSIELGSTMYVYMYNVCIILASEASQKKNVNNKLKTTFGPPLLLIKPLHNTPPLTNLRGVRTPSPPPLDPRLRAKLFRLPLSPVSAKHGRHKRLKPISSEIDTFLTFTELSGFYGAFATDVACQQGTLTLPDIWFRPPFGTCLCSNCWDQIPRTCHVFTRLLTLNTPWYSLDFALFRTQRN